VDAFPDLRSLSDDALKAMIEKLQKEEQEVSFHRRILHGQIDILRAELVARLAESGGRSVLDQVDVEQLTKIITGRDPLPE
jgi:hypothetical protein